MRRVLKHYEKQSVEEAIAEDEGVLRILDSRQEVPVTDLLRKAFEPASRLPKDEQDAVAGWLLAELAAEEDWKARFARTQGTLSELAREESDERGRG